MLSDRKDQLITEVTAREYFHEAVQDAVTNQKISVCDETVIYITNLLTIFIRSEKHLWAFRRN